MGLGAASKVKYEAHSRFHSDLRALLGDHFAGSRDQERGGRRLLLKSSVIVLWAVLSYGALLLVAHSIGSVVVLSLSLGLALAGVGFNLSHDGGHGASARTGIVNRAMALSLDAMGGSSYMWRWKHNVIHHSYPNICGVDDDIEMGSLARLTPEQRHRWFHRFQHLYMWAMFALLPLKWLLVDDFRAVVMGKIGDHRIPRPRGWDLVILLSGKLFFLAWAIVVPLLFHSGAEVILVFLLATGIQGIALGTVFMLAHCVSEARFPVVPPETRRMGSEWAVHQVETAVDFARNNRLLTWYLGGLNFQIEHHLFPEVSHVHYPALSRLVEATCSNAGVRYTAQPSFLHAIRSHFRWLYAMGRPATVATT